MEIIGSTTQQKAKKEHKCNYCDGIIPIGSSYRRQALKYDYFYIWKSHLNCEAIAYELRMFDHCDEGVTNEDFYENIKEEFHKLQGEEDLGVSKFSEILDYVCEKHGIKTQTL
jgi:hypothetical protein